MCGCMWSGPFFKFKKKEAAFFLMQNERYLMCDAAVLKIPHIARSEFFQQVDSQCYIRGCQGILFWMIHIRDNVFKLRTFWQEVNHKNNRPGCLRSSWWLKALVIVLQSRFVKQHLFQFNTTVPTSAVNGSDSQKTKVFKESQVILVQCKKKRINVYSPTLLNFINYFGK